VTTPDPITYYRVIRQFTDDGVWTKPASLVYMRVIVISAGGGGSSTRGGGGGGVVEIPDRPRMFWPDAATITVGKGGAGDGGYSEFEGVRVPGGKSGANGGAGAAAIIRGGAGSTGTGESTTSAPRSLLSGGGGGGVTGGTSGLGFRDGGTLLYAGVLQCGSGGGVGPGEWPAGGGGRGGYAGADGCVTIIETHVEE